MRTEQLYYVLEAAKTGSFTKAAGNLFIKQPGLRAAINTLEEEMGFEIFSRSSKGVILTESGEKAIPVFREIVQKYELLKRNSLLKQTKPTNLRVSINVFYEGLILKQSAVIMENLYPDVKLQFFNANNTLKQMEMLLSQQIDLAIVHASAFLFSTNKYLAAQLNHNYLLEIIAREKLTPLVSPKHPLLLKKSCEIKDLSQYTLIFHGDGDQPVAHYLKYLIKDFEKINYVYLSKCQYELQDVLEDNGIYFCPSLLADYRNLNMSVLPLEEVLNLELILVRPVNDSSPASSAYSQVVHSLFK